MRNYSCHGVHVRDAIVRVPFVQVRIRLEANEPLGIAIERAEIVSMIEKSWTEARMRGKVLMPVVE